MRRRLYRLLQESRYPEPVLPVDSAVPPAQNVQVAPLGLSQMTPGLVSC